jgi:uncharacterized damage-inducible protein DinB
MEPVNVEGNTANLAEMQRLGAPNPPALAVGERIVHGWQPRAYAELAGVPYDGADMLSPDELRRRLERILALAQQALREADGESLELKPPGRDRSVRDLGFHIFRLSSAFVEALELGDFPAEWFRETAPPELRSGEALADFGDKVRHRLAAWFATAPVEIYGTTVKTFYGECTVHELLERTTWHAGQHTRQIYHLLREHGLLPAGALDPEVFAGLPMPKEMW